MEKRHMGNAISVNFYVPYLVIVVIVFDVVVLHKLLGFGYSREYEQENISRYPAPYVEFIGKPFAEDHNEYGFRGRSIKESKPEDFKIAFFGGSTGYNGDPPIPEILEKELEKLLGASVFVANFSVVSSNHRQHLHGIIEYLTDFKPDLVIFYGGWNETIVAALYDPRPGYPYNYFYRAETGPFAKILLENSALIGEIDKRTGVFTGINKLRKEQQPFSDDWDKRIADKYFETLALANNISGTIESRRFGRARFFAFYQPHNVPEEFLSTRDYIKNKIGRLGYGFDVSPEYDILGKGVYKDAGHVNQQAKEYMGARIANIVFNETLKCRDVDNCN